MSGVLPPPQNASPRLLDGRVAIITDAERGVALEIATAYARAGARVVISARDAEVLASAADGIREAAGTAGHVEAMTADLTDIGTVQELIDRARRRFGQLHILVTTAGVSGPLGTIENVDWEDWVRAIEMNVHGSVLPCRAVLPHFKAERYGKIVQIAGSDATTLPRTSAHVISTMAIARFAETLAFEVKDDGIDVNAIAPGEAERNVVARLAVFLGSAASDGVSGRLLSPGEDAWERLPERREELARTDIYTLRRIVPKDRGQDWGDR